MKLSKCFKFLILTVAFITLLTTIGCVAKETVSQNDQSSNTASTDSTVTSSDVSSDLGSSDESSVAPSSSEVSSTETPSSSDAVSSKEDTKPDPKPEPEPEPDPYEGMKRIKVMSYNIRCLRSGVNGDGYKNAMTEAQMNDTIAKFDSLLTREAPDILIVTEDRTFFDTGCFETSGGTKSVYDLMFKKHFPYAYHTAGGANWPHIYSKYPLKDITRLDVAYGTGISDSRKPTLATVTVEGVDINIVACHPISDEVYANTNRADYFKSVVEYVKNKEYVIIAGDMNTDSADPAKEYKPFKDAGLTLGNFGTFGEFVTYRFGTSKNKIDNIIVKGLKMKNFWVGTEDYSDHFPVYSEIYLDK